MGVVDSESKAKKYRWLEYNTYNKNNNENNNGINNENNNEVNNGYLVPLNIDKCANLEKELSKYNDGLSTKYFFKNDYKDKLLTLNNQGHFFKRILTPVTDKMTFYPLIRNKKFSKNCFDILKPHFSNYLNELKMFYYSEIFKIFKIDKADNFIVHFTNHCTILPVGIIDVIKTNLIKHLKNYSKNIFNFDLLKHILIKDFKSYNTNKLSAYYKYFIKTLTKENFNIIIIQMYIEEGELNSLIDKLFSKEDENPYVLLYFLCLKYVFDIKSSHSEIEATYKTIETVDLEIFSIGNSLVNKEFVSTTKNIEILEKNNENIIEINFGKPSLINWDLCLKFMEMENYSQYEKEKEVVIQPYSIFEIRNIKKISNEKYYIKLFLRTNTFSKYSELNLSTIIQKNLGIYNAKIGKNEKINSEYDCNDLERICSITFKDTKNLMNNIKNIPLMKNLRSINLNNIKMEDKDLIKLVPSLSNLKFLSCINLTLNNLTHKSLQLLCQNMNNFKFLEYLLLDQNNFGDEGMFDLSDGIKNVYDLKVVSCFSNQIKSDGIEKISKDIEKFKNIFYLNFSVNYLFCEEIDNLISAVKNLPNLIELNLSNNQIASEGLYYLGQALPKSLKILNISENEIYQEAFAEFGPYLIRVPNLTHFINYGNRNGPNGLLSLLKGFEDTPHLKVLNLGYTTLNDTEFTLLIKNIKNIKNIKELLIRENSLSDNVLIFLLNAINILNKIEVIDISWNAFTGEMLTEFINIIKTFENFRYLNIEGNPCCDKTDYIKNWTDLLNNDEKEEWIYSKGIFEKKNNYYNNKTFAAKYISQKKVSTKNILYLNDLNENDFNQELNSFKKYENIKKMQISRNKFKIKDMQKFTDNLKTMKNLTILDLSKNELNNDDIITLSKGLQYITLLEELCLKENNINGNDFADFANNLKFLTKLKKLDLNWNNINDEGLISLKKNKFASLKILLLRENHISDKGFIEFSKSLKNFSNLNKMDFSWNNIGGEGFKVFSENISFLIEINDLMFEQNFIDDTGMVVFGKNLSKISTIENLYFWKNKIGNLGAKSIMEGLPEYNILKYIDLSVNMIDWDVKEDLRDKCDYLKINLDI